MELSHQQNVCRLLKAAVIGVAEELVPFNTDLHINVTATFIADSQPADVLTFQEKLYPGVKTSSSDDRKKAPDDVRRSSRLGPSSSSQQTSSSEQQIISKLNSADMVVSNVVKQAVRLWCEQSRSSSNHANFDTVAADIGLDFVKQWDWPAGSPESNKPPGEHKKPDSQHNSNHKYECKECGNRFAFATNLTRHYKKIHGISKRKDCKDAPEYVEDPNLHIKPFKCLLCGKECPLYQNLGLHMLKSHGVRVVDLEMQGSDDGQISSIGKGKFKCHLCGHRFSFQSNLSRHYTKIHKKSRSKIKLRAPMKNVKNTGKTQKRTSTKEKECLSQKTTNGKVFTKSTASERARHKCDFCTSCFTFRSNLTRHVNKEHRKKTTPSTTPKSADVSSKELSPITTTTKASPVAIQPKLSPVNSVSPAVSPPNLLTYATSTLTNTVCPVTTSPADFTRLIAVQQTPTSCLVLPHSAPPHQPSNHQSSLPIVVKPAQTGISPPSAACGTYSPSAFPASAASNQVGISAAYSHPHAVPPYATIHGSQTSPMGHSSPAATASPMMIQPLMSSPVNSLSPTSPPMAGFQHPVALNQQLDRSIVEQQSPHNATGGSVQSVITITPHRPGAHRPRHSKLQQQQQQRTMKKFVCLKCDSTFSFESNVKRHFLNQHATEGIRPVDPRDMYKEVVGKPLGAALDTVTTNHDCSANVPPVKLHAVANGSSVHKNHNSAKSKPQVRIVVGSNSLIHRPKTEDRSTKTEDMSTSSNGDKTDNGQVSKRSDCNVGKPRKYQCHLCVANYTLRTNLTRHVRHKHGQAEYDKIQTMK